MTIRPAVFEDRYFLPQIFDRKGLAMFGPEWTGNGMHAREAEDTSKHRKEFLEELDRIRRRLLVFADDIPSQLSEEENLERSREAGNLYAHQNEIRKRLNSLPLAHPAKIRDAENYRRGNKVRETLWKAFEAKDLKLWFPCGSGLDWEILSVQEGFLISYETSTVRLAPDNGRHNFELASPMLDKNELNDWLGRFDWHEAINDKLSILEKCRVWLSKETQNPKKAKKAVYLHEAQNIFEGLTERQFNNVWANTVPESWKSTKR